MVDSRQYLQCEIFVFENCAVNTFTECTIITYNITTLCHKYALNFVEFDAFVVQWLAKCADAPFARAQTPKVFGRLWNHIFSQFDNHTADYSCSLHRHKQIPFEIE